LRVGDLSQAEFEGRLKRDGVTIRWGPFSSNLVCTLPELAAPLRRLYADFPVESGGIRDFHIRLGPAPGPFARLKSEAEFHLDDVRPFQTFSRRTALSMLEWGLNWCVYTSAHQYLILHAAVIARDDRALLLSGRPGAGKSTLCAALTASGWRLLSDELTLVDLNDGRIWPVGRPICLKNESIEVISRFVPGAVFGPLVEDTPKGTVCHMRPPAESVRRLHERAEPRWIVLPRFCPEGPPAVEPITKARAFFELADNSFNYEILGEIGFQALRRLVDGIGCSRFSFSELDDAVAAIDRLTAGVRV
jgi:hypothetical protein